MLGREMYFIFCFNSNIIDFVLAYRVSVRGMKYVDRLVYLDVKQRIRYYGYWSYQVI